MKQPKLSVVIPTLDRQTYAIDTARQLMADAFRDIEIIIVDQSDRLDKETIAAVHEASDPRLYYYHVQPKSGVAAKNFGLECASAEIVLFLDDDIKLDPLCLRAHYNAYQNHPGLGSVAGRVKQHNIPVTDQLLHFNKYGISGYKSFNYTKAEFTDTAPGGNMSVRRSEALKIGGFDTNFVRSQHREESEFSARYVRAGNTMYFEPKASLTHLAAHYGGTRHAGDFADFPDFYRNNMYFVLRYCDWRDLPLALVKQLRFYCLRKQPITTIRRSLLFSYGLAVAVFAIAKPRKLKLKLVQEYHYE